MPFILRPICEFLEDTSTLKRVPKELVPLAEKPLPWTGYLAFGEDRALVGVCAFKDVPDENQQVEIAYYTFPEFERRGFATHMARELVALAREAEDARVVLAHTLRKENASARICRRLEFEFKGEVVDPEDGLVWQWRMNV